MVRNLDQPISTSEPAAARPSGKIEDYRLLAPIGAGSLGEVWKAERAGVPVALKILTIAQDATDTQRKLLALEKLRALRHPQLLGLRNCWCDGHNLFIELDWAEGGSLQDRLQACKAAGKRGVPETELLKFFREAAQGLDYLHSQQPPLLHRNLKPANLLLVDGSVKLGDVGLLRALAVPRGSAYLAPEALDGKSYSGYADLFALAACYAELRQGESPFPGATAQDVCERIRSAPPRLAEALHPAERKVLLRALDKDPRQRPSSCGQFVADLQRVVPWKPATKIPTLVPPSVTAAASPDTELLAESADRTPPPDQADERRPEAEPAEPTAARWPSAWRPRLLRVACVAVVLLLASGTGWLLPRVRSRLHERFAGPARPEAHTATDAAERLLEPLFHPQATTPAAERKAVAELLALLGEHRNDDTLARRVWTGLDRLDAERGIVDFGDLEMLPPTPTEPTARQASTALVARVLDRRLRQDDYAWFPTTEQMDKIAGWCERLTDGARERVRALHAECLLERAADVDDDLPPAAGDWYHGYVQALLHERHEQYPEAADLVAGLVKQIKPAQRRQHATRVLRTALATLPRTAEAEAPYATVSAAGKAASWLGAIVALAEEPAPSDVTDWAQAAVQSDTPTTADTPSALELELVRLRTLYADARRLNKYTERWHGELAFKIGKLELLLRHPERAAREFATCARQLKSVPLPYPATVRSEMERAHRYLEANLSKLRDESRP